MDTPPHEGRGVGRARVKAADATAARHDAVGEIGRSPGSVFGRRAENPVV